jgi:hypothetical protein
MKDGSNEEVLAKGEFSLEKIFLSNDFFYSVDLQLFKYIIKSENIRNGKGSVARQGKNNNQKTTKNSNQNIGIKNEIEALNLFGKINITLQLFKSKFNKNKNQDHFSTKKNINEDNFYHPHHPVKNSKMNSDYINDKNFENNMHSSKLDKSILEEKKNPSLIQQENEEFVRVDYDGLLVLYLNVGELKFIKNTNQMFESGYKKDHFSNNPVDTKSDTEYKNFSNLFISHKIFPNTDYSCSEIIWNKYLPNFKYQMMMPFNLTSRTIDLLFSDFVIEVWHKGNEEDILLGTAKIPLTRIIDFLKVDENTLSITNLEKSILPLIIHDDFAPVFSYVEFTNIFFLHMTLGVGTTSQVHYYMRKFFSQSNNTDFPKKINMISSDEEANKGISKENLGKKFNTFNDSNNKSIKEESYHHEHNKIDADEINIINQLLNNNKDNVSKKEIYEDVDDVQNILERNKELIKESSKNENDLNKFEDLKDQSDNKNISKNEKKNNYGNPFLVNPEKPQGQNFPDFSNKYLNNNEDSYESKNKNEHQESLYHENSINSKNAFKVSKESNFFIKEEKGSVKNNRPISDSVLDGKLTENDFFKTGKMEKIENISIGENIPNFKNLENFNEIEKNFQQKNNELISVNNKKTCNSSNNNYSENKNFNNAQENVHINKEDKIENHDNKETNSEFLSKDFKKNIRQNEKVDPSDLPLNDKKGLSIVPNKNSNENLAINNHNKCLNTNQILSNKVIRHVFSISIEKLINLNIISKLNGKAFLKFKFLGENEYVKSDTLLYSQIDKEKSIIELDMQTSHSIITDRIKDYLQDFTILFCYLWNDDEHVFGKVNIPSEELLSVLNRRAEWTLFIYGTDVIDRKDCIIGKMKMKMDYYSNENEQVSGDVINERQIEYSRKIPKNMSLSFKIFYINFKRNLDSTFNLKNKKNLIFYHLLVEPFSEDSNLNDNIGYRESTRKKYESNLNGIFEESFTIDFVIDHEILEYMKTKYVMIHIVILKNYNEEFYENEMLCDENSRVNNKDNFFRKINQEETVREYCYSEILGTAKIKFVDILTNVNFTCEELIIYDKYENEIASLNLEIKLDQFQKNPEQENFQKVKKTKSKLKEVFKKENENDGKFFFVINLENIILDEHFFKKISFSHGKQFFMMYTLGKDVKKITDIYNLDMLRILDSPALYIFEMNFIDFNELKLSFSKKSPEDLFIFFYENVFEIKFFIKKESENKHIGSFMIDLSKLFLGTCKITSKVFYSQDITIDFYDIEEKSKSNVKLGLNFSLFKSDLLKENFFSLYSDVRSVFFNNIEFFKNNLYPDKLKKILPNMLKDSYEYLDYYLFNLEDDKGHIILEHFVALFKVFTTLDLQETISNNEEKLDWINFLFTTEKKIEWTTDINNRNKFLIKLKCIKDKKVENTALHLKKLLGNYENFGVYSHNYNSEDKIDILDYILRMYKIHTSLNNFQVREFSEERNYNENKFLYQPQFCKNTGIDSVFYSYKYEDNNQYDNETLWRKLHQNTVKNIYLIFKDDIMFLTKEIDLEKNNNLAIFQTPPVLVGGSLTEKFDFYEQLNPFMATKDNNIIEKDKEYFEDRNSSFNMSMGNFSKIYNEDKILPEEKSTLNMNIKDKFNQDKLIRINSSFEKDEIEIIKKGPQTCSVKSVRENEKELQNQSVQANQSMFETVKRPLNFKKPPSPALNKLYKNADKNFLNRIQNILKKKEDKKLSYATSEESN